MAHNDQEIVTFTNRYHLTKLVLHQAQLNQSFQRLQKQIKFLSPKTTMAIITSDNGKVHLAK